MCVHIWVHCDCCMWVYIWACVFANLCGYMDLLSLLHLCAYMGMYVHIVVIAACVCRFFVCAHMESLSLPGKPVRYHNASADIPTTVYVGHLCSKIPDSSILEILSVCGNVLVWNRQKDPISGKLTNFGFCEYSNAKSASAAISCLDGVEIGSKKIVVKGDSKIATGEFDVGSTIMALVTTVNSQWRKQAMESDAQPAAIVPTKTAPTKTHDVLNVARGATFQFPKWFSTSRREKDRTYKIERKNRERKSEFDRLLRDWNHESKRLIRQLTDDFEDERRYESTDGKLRSNFSVSERKRECEWDEKDREIELAELAEDELKFKQKLPHIFAAMNPNAQVQTTETQPTKITLPNIPMNVADLEKFDFDFKSIYSNKHAMNKLFDWILDKLKDRQVCEWIFGLLKDSQSVNELIFKISQLHDSPNVEYISIRLFQMMAFVQLTS